MHIHIFIAFNSIKYSNVRCAGSVIGGVRGLDKCDVHLDHTAQGSHDGIQKSFLPLSSSMIFDTLL